jgi:hypothetical protein
MAFSGSGSGTSESPYLITSWAQLNEIKDELDAFYKLNVDLDSNSNGYNTYASSSANSGNGWLPIGSNTDIFTGTFDGDGHTVSDLYIYRTSTDYVGLFGYSSGTIKNVGILNMNITGQNWVGAIGRNHAGIILNCYSTGIVKGLNYVGGLIGYQFTNGTITNCYSQATVIRLSGTGTAIGGFLGRNYQGSVTKSYSTGDVQFLGTDNPTNCGFIGTIGTGGGYADSGNFWDTETSNQSTSAGSATGKTTSQMKDYDTFDGASWDIVKRSESYDDEVWIISDGNGYPRLFYSFLEITSWEELNYVRNYVTGNYILINNINELSDGYDTYASSSANSGVGWIPMNFTGNFNGNGKIISGLFQDDEEAGGLFEENEGDIYKLGLENLDISCDEGGGICTRNYGNIYECYTKGNIIGIGLVGGLVGLNWYGDGDIENCYSECNVNGGYVGGLVGANTAI